MVLNLTNFFDILPNGVANFKMLVVLDFSVSVNLFILRRLVTKGSYRLFFPFGQVEKIMGLWANPKIWDNWKRYNFSVKRISV